MASCGAGRTATSSVSWAWSRNPTGAASSATSSSTRRSPRPLRCSATSSSCGARHGAGSRRIGDGSRSAIRGRLRDHMASARRMLALACALALAALLGMAGVALSDAPRGTNSARGQALFGMSVPSLGQLAASESKTGLHAAVVGTYADWAHTPDFPRRQAEAINARGAVPMFSWEPWDSWRGGTDQPTYALRRIATGDHDALIDRWATEIARYGRPVMLRFAPEMNGDWLPWSTGVNGNRPGDYVAAWRHVRARFRRAGAANAVWVWNPIAAYAGSTPLGALSPGAAGVDWRGGDGFNGGARRAGGWQSPADIFAPTLRAFATLAPRRPVMI